MSSLQPLELDYLVDSLRNPSPTTSVLNILSYLYNYVPYVKQQHNLKIVFSSFLNNPTCFGDNPSFEDSYLVIEVMKLIFDKKLKVSHPTLEIKQFYETVYNELRAFVAFNPVLNSWKALPILAGLNLSLALRDELNVSGYPFGVLGYFKDFDRSSDLLFRSCISNVLSYNRSSVDISNLAILSLALKRGVADDINRYLRPSDKPFVASSIVELLYGPAGYGSRYTIFENPDPSQYDMDLLLHNPVIKHINKVSSLLEKLFQSLNYREGDYEVIFRCINSILAFNQKLNKFVQTHSLTDQDPHSPTGSIAKNMDLMWFFFKSVFFSQVLIFQGIMSRFIASRNNGIFKQFLLKLSQKSEAEFHYTEISYIILHCLYYANFILVSIGQGGFDGFNFVYYVCLELCCKNNTAGRFQTFSRTLIGNYEVNTHHQALNASYVSRSKVLFALGLFENYFQQTAFLDKQYEAFIYNVTFDLTENQYLKDSAIVEAGHSVLLAFFSKSQNDPAAIKRVLTYFEVLLAQFPSRISPTQLSIAVETLGKIIMTSPVHYSLGLYETLIDQFLQLIYSKCLNAKSGVSITNKSSSIFQSPQPIPSTDANSTVSQLPETSTNTNVVGENKHEKLKDFPVINVLLFESGDSKGHFAVRQSPETAREGFLVAFFNIIPYLPLSIFEIWLDKIWFLILASNNTEKTFLLDKLWTILSENLDLNRCEIAYIWWYEKKHNVERMNLASSKL